MTARFDSTQPAPDGIRYAPECFDGCVGREFEAGRLIAAEVAEDGTSVRLTFETDRLDDLARPGAEPPPYSIGFRPRRETLSDAGRLVMDVDLLSVDPAPVPYGAERIYQAAPYPDAAEHERLFNQRVRERLARTTRRPPTT